MANESGRRKGYSDSATLSHLLRLQNYMEDRVQRVARFIAAGGSAATVNFALLYTLTEYFHIWYLASSLVAVVAGFITSFILQKFWTFKNKRLDRVHIQAMLHASLSIVNIILNTVLLYTLVEYVHLWYIAALCISPAYFSGNFWRNIRWSANAARMKMSGSTGTRRRALTPRPIIMVVSAK